MLQELIRGGCSFRGLPSPPTAMPFFRTLLLLSAFALFTGCGDEVEEIEPGGDDPEVELTEPEEALEQAAENADVLMGLWVVAEQNGEAPTERTTMEFAADGRVTLIAGSGVQQVMAYTLADDFLILEGDDSTSTRYQRMGEADGEVLVIDEELGDELVLRDPDDESRNLVLRRPAE